MLFRSVRRCVVGMLTGRDVDDMVAPLVESGIAVFYVSQPQSPRAMDRHVVADAIRRAGGVVHLSDTCVEALQRAREESAPDDLIVAAGSLYLVAEVRGSILGIASRSISSSHCPSGLQLTDGSGGAVSRSTTF